MATNICPNCSHVTITFGREELFGTVLGKKDILDGLAKQPTMADAIAYKVRENAKEEFTAQVVFVDSVQTWTNQLLAILQEQVKNLGGIILEDSERTEQSLAEAFLFARLAGGEDAVEKFKKFVVKELGISKERLRLPSRNSNGGWTIPTTVDTLKHAETAEVSA